MCDNIINNVSLRGRNTMICHWREWGEAELVKLFVSDSLTPSLSPVIQLDRIRVTYSDRWEREKRKKKKKVDEQDAPYEWPRATRPPSLGKSDGTTIATGT